MAFINKKANRRRQRLVAILVGLVILTFLFSTVAPYFF